MRGVSWSCAVFVTCATFLCACGDDDDSDFESVRDVANLTNCIVTEQGHYYLGAIFSYAGSSPTGPSRQQAVQQALIDINASNVGVHGRKLGLIACNSNGDPATAAARVTELLQADPPVTAIIAGSRSAEVVAEVPVAIANEIVLMAGSSTTPALTSLADNGWVSRAVQSDTLQGAVLAKVALDAGLDKVFVAHVNDAYGAGLNTAFAAAFRAGGGTTTSIAYASGIAGTPTAADIIDAQLAFGQATTMIIGFPTEGTQIVPGTKTAGYTPTRWMFTDSLRDVNFTNAVQVRGDIRGSLGTVPSSPAGAAFEGFTSRYQRSWNATPGTYGANFYDATMLLGLAMQLASDPEDRTLVRDALLQRTHSGTEFTGDNWSATARSVGSGELNYAGASGAVDLDANGDVVGNIDTWTIDASDAIARTGCFEPGLTTCQ